MHRKKYFKQYLLGILTFYYLPAEVGISRLMGLGV